MVWKPNATSKAITDPIQKMTLRHIDEKVEYGEKRSKWVDIGRGRRKQSGLIEPGEDRLIVEGGIEG